jgi:hypothetical protein
MSLYLFYSCNLYKEHSSMRLQFVASTKTHLARLMRKWAREQQTSQEKLKVIIDGELPQIVIKGFDWPYLYYYLEEIEPNQFI